MQIKVLVFEIFLAGTETSVSSIYWALLFMAKYPEVQKRVQAEIDNVIGDRAPINSDRAKLKYVEAVMCESYRVSSFVRLATLRNLKTTTLRGYTIPANSMVLPNLYAIHCNPKIWIDPDHFHVENFLDEKANSLKNTEHLLQFGIGI